MDDQLAAPISSSGYRLHKLELYNWGTFDSCRGVVHTVRPDGSTTLLIGQNGSGKSTLVDAILTLLVRPVVRNYNVAAGAHKQERDERTYIKGAYGRFSRDEDNKAAVQYLRSDGKHYSAILACFKNNDGSVFTVAQVLYLATDGSPEKVYCLADREMSIAEHCAKLVGTEKVRQQLEKRGFRATTTYSEYFSWFQRQTGVRQKAMDMFNQTVAVKDIQSLNRFIREHMLEAKPWREKIDSLQLHFTQLSDAHQSLVRVRKQYSLLSPVVSKGKEYTEKASDLTKTERLKAAAHSFFRNATIEIFEPLCELKAKEIVNLGQAILRHDESLTSKRDDVRRLQNEIDAAGGDRLKELPGLIDKQNLLRQMKLTAWQSFKNDIDVMGLQENLSDATSFNRARDTASRNAASIGAQIQAIEEERNDALVNRATLSNRKREDEAELQSLMQRHGNLPEALSAIRRKMCEDLRLSDKDLSFAAELIAVKPDQREWQSSIEMVLRKFALSLLVPTRHYGLVASYIDRTRLIDGRGQGQRLSYVKVGERTSVRSKPPLHAQSLLRKLDTREGHPLLPWVKGELEDRFDLRCCDSIEEFQATADWAVTKQRHIKWRSERHDKDDRERTADPRNFVLGWENREKRRLLAEGITRLTGDIENLGRKISAAEGTIEQLRKHLDAAARIREISGFETIDFAAHERERIALEQEKKALEDNNEVIRTLRSRIDSISEECEKIQKLRDTAIREEERAKQDLRNGNGLVTNAKLELKKSKDSGQYGTHQELFGEILEKLNGNILSMETLFEVEANFTGSLSIQINKLREVLNPLAGDVRDAMNKYLMQFPDERADLNADIKYLDSFCALHDLIEKDDLPRHEARFKEHMNEKVIHEIGLLNGAFLTERTEIVSKIELLNQSLKQLEYRPGTFMRLLPKDVRDREILEFKDSLRECLSGTFEGSLEADEARYVRIEKFLARLRDETRWCEKVTDVRRWFDFVALELDVQTEKERAYYEDSTGQSGGEKAKLAFTILVAAIAYQYDLDPMRPSNDRFHFVVVDEMFSKVDDQYSEYALELFKRFGLQLLIVAPLDSKARVTEPHVGCYLHVIKDGKTNCSEIYSMSAREFEEAVLSAPPETVTN